MYLVVDMSSAESTLIMPLRNMGNNILNLCIISGVVVSVVEALTIHFSLFTHYSDFLSYGRKDRERERRFAVI